jgi:integrase
MATSKPTSGIDVRHRKACPGARADGKCCTPTFRAHVFDARNGRRIRKTFATKTAAKQWRTDAQAAIRAGTLPTGNSRTVRQALEDLIAGMRDGTVLDRSGRRYRPATIRSYQHAADKHLSPVGHLRLGDVRRGDIQRLIDRLHAQGMTGSTIRNKLDPLRVVYRRAIQDEEVTHNPTENLRLPSLSTKPRRIGDPGRVGALLDALSDSERAAWACAFYAGLRVGELRALRWEHVRFDDGVIRVQAGWDDAEGEQDTKTQAGARTIPLTGRLRTELARHRLATGRTGHDLCFGRTRAAAFTRSTLRARAIRAWDGAGLEPLTPHEARHTCASYLAAAGLTPKEMQTAMGHADIRTTLNIYAKAVPGWESDAAAKLDAYLDRATVARQSTPLAVRS